MSEINSLTDVDDINVVDTRREAFDEWFNGLEFVYHVVPPLDAWVAWQACTQSKQLITKRESPFREEDQ
tara:strand:+ start:5291 stop:5497 length:207 start_codon:yes stop_codon:yes gene_type:complete